MADVGDSSAPPLPKLEPGASFAGYRIEAVLDRGGIGVVCRASDPDRDRSIALKIIAPQHTQDPVAVARFKANARLAASLDHPNIVPIHRGGEHEGVFYLAMRLVPGTSVREIIGAAPLDLTRIVRLVSEVADALDTAHAAGLVHRDVKPANILVAGQGQHEHAYLSAFGLPKRFESAGDLTPTGGWVGTPDYVAPEQVQGHEVDGRADIYSLGCVVYEMLTGHVAYPRDSPMATLWAHVTDPPPLPRRHRRDLVPSFDAVVARATAKAPGERFATARELAAALRAAVGEQEAERRSDTAQVTQLPQTDEPASTPDDVFVDHRPRAGADGESAVPVASAGTGPQPPVDPRARRRRHGALAAAAALLLLGAAAAAAFISDGSSGGRATPSGTPVHGELAAVAYNKVKGVGKVEMRLSGDTARVHLTATGLLDGSPHLMHIHAGAKGECPHGDAASEHNGHTVITTQDGAPFYGPPVASLTISPAKTGSNAFLDVDHFPSAVPINYSRSINFGAVLAAQIRQNTGAVVVVHGIDYNRNGKYDNGLSLDTELRRLPIEETAPALCGALTAEQSNSSSPGTASAARVYTATLVPAPAPHSAPAFHCDLRSLADKLL